MSKCTWREDVYGHWRTDCGGYFDLWDVTPSEDGMLFCCYCGGKLVEVEYTEPETEPPEVAATLSLCCGIIQLGWHKPSAMHNALCRERNGGELGSTYYLTMDADGTLRARP